MADLPPPPTDEEFVTEAPPLTRADAREAALRRNLQRRKQQERSRHPDESREPVTIESILQSNAK